MIFINIPNIPKYAEGSTLNTNQTFNNWEYNDYNDEIITPNMLKNKFITILPNLPTELSKLDYDTSAITLSSLLIGKRYKVQDIWTDDSGRGWIEIKNQVSIPIQCVKIKIKEIKGE